MHAHVFDKICHPTEKGVYQYFDGATWKESASGKRIPIVSPIDESIVGYIPEVTTKEMDEVVTRAKKAQITWNEIPLYERVKMMHLVADWLHHYKEHMTTMLVKEIGKTVSDAENEVERSADLIDYYANDVIALHGETRESDSFPGVEKGKTAMIEYAPHGVVLCIAPFNYPLNLAVSKIVPALLMGNSVIFKPPTQGAIVGLFMTALFEIAGIKNGVLSCVTGSGSSVGAYLSAHTDIDMVAFTGSSAVGESLARTIGMKPMLFECGGNNGVIVLPDANMGKTAEEIVKGAFSYSGQRCTGIKYIVAPAQVMESLRPHIITAIKKLVVVGDPRDTKTKLVGPVISLAAAQEIKQKIDSAIEKGATLLVGGTVEGNSVEATVLDHVTMDMDIVKSETFGPVLSLVSVQSMQEAIDIINHSAYGLQASIFSQDEGAALHVARKICVGTVQINGSPQRGPDHFPFMGIKSSGVGVQGVRYALEAMARITSIVLNNPA